MRIFHFPFFLFVFYGAEFWTVRSRIAPSPPNGYYNQKSGSIPGLKIRLTQRGADYLKAVGVKLLNEQISTMRGFHLQQEIQPPGLPAGQIFVNDVRTLGYRPPIYSNLYFVSPSFMMFDIRDAGITLTGRFNGVFGPFQIAGQVHGQLFGLTISLTTQFRVTSEGNMLVNVIQCRTQMQYAHFTLEPEGPLGPLVKIFEGPINDMIRQRIPDRLCRGIQDIVERNSPTMFRKLTHADVGEHFGSLNESSILESFIHKFTEGLFLDGRMVTNPIITPEFFETQQKGELRYYQSSRSVPFYPNPIPLDRDSSRMIYIYASDYTLNSLLYHAYELDKLSIEIDQKTLPEPFKAFVRTTCSDIDTSRDFLKSICVGKIIPAIARAYPNTTARFTILPHELPEVRFLDGHSTMDLKARILTYVKDLQTGRDRQILVSSADGLADIKPNAENGAFTGDLKLRKLNLSLHRSAIEIDPESIEQLAPLAKTFLGPELARGIKKGLPYPLQDSITFIRPKLKIYQGGYMRLATDFEINEQSLRPKIAEAFERIRNGA